VPLLLADPDTEVWLLVRADSDPAMAERLKELRRFWGWENDAAEGRRMHGLLGDAAQPRFGLASSQYEELAGKCTHIIHCAGTVRMNLPLEDARRSAVGSTEQILGLARRIASAGRLAKVDFVSTVGVAGKRSGTLPEAWLEQMPSFHNTYEQAKAEAEELVRRAVHEDGLPITVHRPSMVIGDSRNGRIVHFQIFYFLCEFLSGRKTLGFYPDFAEVQLDVIPCDVVAAAIVSASRDSATAGQILHLCSGPETAPRLEQVKMIVRQAFVRHGLHVPPAFNIPIRWYARLAHGAAWLAPPRHRRALATLPVYLAHLADRQGFGNAAWREWLTKTEIEIPRPEDYLPIVLNYYLRQRYPAGPAA
jgi:thioester reductase-like protein